MPQVLHLLFCTPKVFIFNATVVYICYRNYLYVVYKVIITFCFLNDCIKIEIRNYVE